MPLWNNQTKKWDVYNHILDEKGHPGNDFPTAEERLGVCETSSRKWMEDEHSLTYKPDSTDPLSVSRSRQFTLQRVVDESGVSGTGAIAEGVEFTTGWCALSWLTKAHSVGVYPNIKELERIHGHNGRTKIVWVD